MPHIRRLRTWARARAWQSRARYVLAKCLKAAETAEAGLLAYEQARFDRTAMITNQSWKFGKMFAYENPLKCWFRNRLFGLLGGLAVKQTEKVIGVEV